MFEDGRVFPEKETHFFSENISHEKLQTLCRKYDEYLAYVDAEFGRLYDALERSGQLENTYLILTSDHGQMFERGIHGHVTPVLYEPLIDVPLIIAQPGQSKREDVYGLTSAVDILPTLLYLSGSSIPGWVDGQILPGIGEPAEPQRSVFALEAKDSSLRGALEQGTVAMIQDSYKLIHYFGYPGYEDVYELYDLQADPEELVNLHELMPEIVKEFGVVLENILK
jgi:arylsulfatase A-like enzyme